MITKNSEIIALLSSVGLRKPAGMSEPPKSYIATMLDAITNKAHTIVFQTHPTSEEAIGPEEVIRRLLQAHYPDIKLVFAELIESTMEWFLDKHITSENSRAIIPGSAIRIQYATNSDRKPAKKGAAGWAPAWIYLPDAVKLIIGSNDPFLIDDDGATLKRNLGHVEKEIETQLAYYDRRLQHYQQEYDLASAALKEIQQSKASCK